MVLGALYVKLSIKQKMILAKKNSGFNRDRGRFYKMGAVSGKKGEVLFDRLIVVF